ncbi:STAS domain-containing protein [Streptomyces sp. NPDC029674]|uniref:STAS domain-containing protein n=1 Tax=Streptomyces sp. NPDC029674 TaxID=3365297 RepID=UPI003850546A
MEQEPQPRLVIRHVPAGRSVVLVCLAGELDVDTVTSLREAIVQAASWPEGDRLLLLELSNLTYCDNAGVFTLLGICQAMDAAAVTVGIEAGIVASAAIDRAGLQGQLPLRPV